MKPENVEKKNFQVQKKKRIHGFFRIFECWDHRILALFELSEYSFKLLVQIPMHTSNIWDIYS